MAVKQLERSNVSRVQRAQLARERANMKVRKT
jgi:hypothetical protein